MIAPVTSLADLYYKAKHDEVYARLVIYAAREFNWSLSDGATLEQAIKAIDYYHEQSDQKTCDRIIARINDYRDYLAVTEQDNTMFIVKNRQAADDARPSMTFRGENLNVYEAAANAYERMRNEGLHGITARQSEGRINRPSNNGNFYITASGFNVEREILESSWTNPTSGEQLTVRRTIQSDIPASMRASIERDMQIELSRRIADSLSNSNELTMHLRDIGMNGENHE